MTARRPSWIALTASLLLASAVSSPAVWADSATGGGAGSPSLTEPPQFEGADRVARLIQSLGSQRYVQRREAEQQLIEIGMPAFDQIDAATDHPDPEISASCRFLVSELTVRWTRRNDPPEVKAALSNYASEPESTRLTVVRKLGARRDRWAIAPLCRISRYDPSAVVARQAAIELLRTDDYPLSYTVDDAQTLRHEIGTSVRPQAEWVRLLAAQIDSPQSVADAWWGAIDRAEADAAVAVDSDEQRAQVTELVRNRVRLALDGNSPDDLLQAVDRLIEHSRVPAVDEFDRLFDWAATAESPQTTEQLIEHYERLLTESKSGLYLLARMRARQGQQELADALAERAFQATVEDSLVGAAQNRLDEAAKLIAAGQVEWARRELRTAIAEVPATSDTHSRAALALAHSLHDWQLDGEAVEVLSAITEPLRSDVNLLKQYESQVRNSMRAQNNLSRLYTLQEIEAYQHYYDASRLHAEGNIEAEWQALEKAYELDETNADIIIAMFWASDGNAERRAIAREAIQKRCRALEQSIDDYPYPAYYASNYYNEWAWLVSNTEGDFRKAVRYSHKSLDLFAEHMAVDRDLEPKDSAGLLDTLGRCYFAAGDFDSAVVYQTEAVEYQPHMRVLQRQLEEFRQAQESGEG